MILHRIRVFIKTGFHSYCSFLWKFRFLFRNRSLHLPLVPPILNFPSSSSFWAVDSYKTKKFLVLKERDGSLPKLPTSDSSSGNSIHCWYPKHSSSPIFPKKIYNIFYLPRYMSCIPSLLYLTSYAIFFFFSFGNVFYSK